MEQFYALLPFVVLIALYAVLRFRPAPVFLALCFGAVLAGMVNKPGFADWLEPYLGPTSGTSVGLFIVLAPAVLILVRTIRGSEPLSLRALPQIIVLLGSGVVLLQVAMPYIDISVVSRIHASDIWQYIKNYGVYVVVAAGIMSLLSLVKKPKLSHESK